MTIDRTQQHRKNANAFLYIKAVFFMIWLVGVLTAVYFAIMPEAMDMPHGADKKLHFLTFCLLMVWPAMTFDKTRNVIAGAFFLFCVGVVIEVLQLYLPMRKTEMMDVVFNTAGTGLGVFIGFLFRDSYRSVLPESYVRRFLQS